ncbi:hypothetical protein A2780_03930 [Candidatus Daviesbacteria bacterium RIFCSPHIGHO2_01_FULL_41_45]|uniref:Uncharacterized protein n=1 Tax=Candidatus Yanofskybacteria bacterium RIFCSPLOWO2_02_FULL_45_10 TaxID=1802706 RepID=A0A1F8H5S6_9BACT|nr:MAG: hypothetical protein A2780_03930 [Candidatus Daviesbacteria bacterium RIFCSPHIGHO2_01_FULL_41_45]OGN32957.1 MAG: hypothetical protein A3I32_01405 [Candidatus Yanofskybacteria bacterium RIFCSPLOWO2_02_FULL_45_10]
MTTTQEGLTHFKNSSDDDHALCGVGGEIWPRGDYWSDQEYHVNCRDCQEKLKRAKEARRAVPSMETMHFLEYTQAGGEFFAKFSDPQTGQSIPLSYQECLKRQERLRTNGWPYEQTERALNGWPK